MNRKMAKSQRDRADDAREDLLAHIREQVSAGELVVRQMTDSERAYWDNHSAEADHKALPEDRLRRDAARKKRRDREERAGRQRPR
jgi:hypothetical protein